jgi:stage II sporulation protein D
MRKFKSIVGAILYGVLLFPMILIHADNTLPVDLNQAKILYYQNLSSSYEQYSQLVNNEPRNEKARFDLTRILRERGQYPSAINHLKILLQQEPDDPNYRLALLETTYMAGEFSETLRLANTKGLTPDEFYWKGLALAELGIQNEAIYALSNAVVGEPIRPLAYYNLGVLYLKIASFDKAVTYLRKAAAQDPNLTQVYLPLVNAYIGLGKYFTAYHYLGVAQDEMSWNSEISIVRKKLLDEHPEILKPQPSSAPEKELASVSTLVTPILDGREKIPEIRIGLAEKVQSLYLKSGAEFHLSDQTGKIRFNGNSLTVLRIRGNNSYIEVLNHRGERLFKTSGSVLMSYENPAATTILSEVRYKRGSFWAGREPRSYRGGIWILQKSDGLTVVNHLLLEEYLYGVIPSEMEYGWPMEALEAQAIAARTYALSHKNNYNSRGFDLLATIASQVYGGASSERTTTNNAVDATRGLILTYKGKPISAFYTGNSGGYTADSQDVWGNDIAYLKAIPDQLLVLPALMGPEDLAEWLTGRPLSYSCNPKYSAPSNYRWSTWVSHEEIERRLRLGDKLGRILTITINERTISGMVIKVTLYGEKGQFVINGDGIRSKLGGLRSNRFIMEPKLGKDGLPELFVFNGGGWGHCVGLDQSGAAGMAADGYKYDEILKHYYSGVEMEELY